MLCMRSSHDGDHPMVPVRLMGRTDTFWTGSGVYPGLFAHLTDFIQLLITFKHCVGMLTKSMIPIPPSKKNQNRLSVIVTARQRCDIF